LNGKISPSKTDFTRLRGALVELVHLILHIFVDIC